MMAAYVCEQHPWLLWPSEDDDCDGPGMLLRDTEKLFDRMERNGTMRLTNDAEPPEPADSVHFCPNCAAPLDATSETAYLERAKAWLDVYSLSSSREPAYWLDKVSAPGHLGALLVAAETTLAERMERLAGELKGELTIAAPPDARVAVETFAKMVAARIRAATRR